MSVRYSVDHRTAYVYASEVQSSYNEARVTPLTTERQTVMESTVEVTPAVPVLRYWDYWGTLVHAFDVHVPHTELAVTGSSVVETLPSAPPQEAGWDELLRPEVADRFAELLAPSAFVGVDAALVEAGRDLAGSASPAEAADAAVAWTRGCLGYEKAATTVATTASEAVVLGAGVCQDFAHVTLALLRAAGIPARYVSGYVFPTSDATVGVEAAGESHAWVEAWTGDWHGLDPTHGEPVGERHIVVARGRDYGDVTPLKGVYRGGRVQELTVRVDVRRLP